MKVGNDCQVGVDSSAVDVSPAEIVGLICPVEAVGCNRA